MLQLTIEDKPAVLQSNTTIKLVRENPAFAPERGDYTFELTLPLAGCVENLDIFGALHRPETTLRHIIDRSFSATLQAEGLWLEGSVRVRGVTERSLKVQFRAGAAALVSAYTDAKGLPRYIDELNLGKAYEDIWAMHHLPEDKEQTEDATIEMFYRLPSHIVRHMLTGAADDLSSTPPPEGWAKEVSHPIYSTADGAWANERTATAFFNKGSIGVGGFYNFPVTEQTSTGLPIYHTHTDKRWAKHWRDDNQCLAPQPYLCEIVERIFDALMGKGALRAQDNALRRICPQLFIANARSGIEWARALPHWTVEEFIAELRAAFGVEVMVRGRRVSIIHRQNLMRHTLTEQTKLQEILHESTAEMDDDANKADPSDANRGYDTQGIDPMFALSDEVWERAVVRRFASLSALMGFVSTLRHEATMAGWLLVEEEGGRTFTVLEGAEGAVRLVEVDHLGTHRQGGRAKTDIRLRIVPAMMVRKPIAAHIYKEEGVNKYERWGNTSGTELPTMITADTRATASTHFAIWDALESKHPAGAEKKEVMEVAYNLPNFYTRVGLGTVVVQIPLPVGFALAPRANDEKYEDLIKEYTKRQENTAQLFSLKRQHTGAAVLTEVNEYSFTVDTRIEHVFRFADNIELNPMKIFHIGTKRYLCKRLEISFTNNGTHPIKTGYFYEMIFHP